LIDGQKVDELPTKKLKCTGCKQRFDRETLISLPGGKFHSIKCATQYAQRRAERNQKSIERRHKREKAKIQREAKESLKTRTDWLKTAQTAFNAYIRERDKADGCISCGRRFAGQYHAGHYRTVKASPELRFNELNCHKQCAQCNNFDSGNIVEYRIRLIKKIGEKSLEWLEGSHQLQRYSIEDVKEITQYYRGKLKDLG